MLALTCILVLPLPATADEPQQLPPLQVTTSASALPPALEQLPVSSTRVEREALDEAQYQVNLSESLGRVPGLVVNHRHNYAQDLQISIRGFGARAAFGVRGIRLYTDGIPATMPDGQGQVSHFDLLGAERATVLRGPFSALYGSSSGGVVELTTREPAASFVEGTGWTGADELRRYGLLGSLAGDAVSVIGSGSWFETAGYREHSAATRAGGQARLTLAGDLVLLANTLDQDAQDPLGLTRAQWEQDPRQAGSNALAYDTRKTTRQSQAGAAWTRALGDAQALRVVGWAGARTTRQFQAIPDTVQDTAAGNPRHPGGVIDLDRGYYGMDLRWLGRAAVFGGPLDVAVGADLEFLDERRQGFQNFTGTPGPTSTKGVLGPQRRDEDNRAASYDPYVQADWQLAPRWLALLGVRYSSVRFESVDRFVIAGNGDDSGAERFKAWLPVAGLRYAPGPLALHAAVSRGSETPTLNELAYRPDGSAGLNSDLEASRSNNYEVGATFAPHPGPLPTKNVGRGDVGSCELPLPACGERAGVRGDPKFALTVFHIDTTDEIVVAGSSGGRTTFRNAAATTRDGVEASAQWQVLPALAATTAYTFIDARYDDAFCPGATCPPTAEVAAGNRLPGVPRHNVFVELAWRDGAQRFSSALEAVYRSAVAVNDAGSDQAPGYAVANLRLAWRLFGGRLQLMARADNLLDRNYVGSVIVNETNGRYFEPAPGLGFGVGVRVGFL